MLNLKQIQEIYSISGSVLYNSTMRWSRGNDSSIYIQEISGNKAFSDEKIAQQSLDFSKAQILFHDKYQIYKIRVYYELSSLLL